MEFIFDIRDHFEKEYPREGCGVLSVVKGKLTWFPCKNIAKDTTDFIIDSSEFMKLNRTTDIVGIVHSHPDRSPEPSQNDINNCNALGIPYYIFSYPEMEMVKLEPKKLFRPLIGREYKFGVQDCFEAAKDYYIENCGFPIKNRDAFEEYWWQRGLDYFSENFINEWGFKKVDYPEKFDLLIFAINTSVGNHCGVYIGDNIFFHHATNRLSCREALTGFWKKYLIGVYRYVA